MPTTFAGARSQQLRWETGNARFALVLHPGCWRKRCGLATCSWLTVPLSDLSHPRACCSWQAWGVAPAAVGLANWDAASLVLRRPMCWGTIVDSRSAGDLEGTSLRSRARRPATPNTSRFRSSPHFETMGSNNSRLDCGISRPKSPVEARNTGAGHGILPARATNSALGTRSVLQQIGRKRSCSG